MQIVGTCLNCLPEYGALCANGLGAATFLSICFVWDRLRRADVQRD